jgi:hypothetical protein
LRNNLARCRWGWSSCSRSRGLSCHRSRRRRRYCRRCRLGNSLRIARFFLFLFFLGQNRLKHIAGLGDVRQVDFWRYRRSSIARTSRTGVAAPRAMRKLHTYLFSLILLQRTGVGFAGAHAEFRQNIKNLSALDFQLPREIVDTNLTHPPLFSIPTPKPLVAHGCLVAMVVCRTCVIRRLDRKDGAHTTRRPRQPSCRLR